MPIVMPVSLVRLAVRDMTMMMVSHVMARCTPRPAMIMGVISGGGPRRTIDHRRSIAIAMRMRGSVTMIVIIHRQTGSECTPQGAADRRPGGAAELPKNTKTLKHVRF